MIDNRKIVKKFFHALLSFNNFLLIKSSDDELVSAILEFRFSTKNQTSKKHILHLTIYIPEDNWIHHCISIYNGKLNMCNISIDEKIPFGEHNVTIYNNIIIQIKKCRETNGYLKYHNYWKLCEIDSDNLAIDRF